MDVFSIEQHGLRGDRRGTLLAFRTVSGPGSGGRNPDLGALFRHFKAGGRGLGTQEINRARPDGI
jgi:hypothetical protein